MPDTSDMTECSWDEFVETYVNANSVDYMEEMQQEVLENLLNIHYNRININEATADELLQLPFVSQAQADSIVSYIAKYGPMYSLGELMLVPRLDYRTRRFLTAFLKCDVAIMNKHTMHEMLTQGQHEVAMNLSVPLYTREGYKKHSSLSNTSKYLGDKNRFAMHYRYEFGDELQLGVTTEKDAGEPLACRGNFFTDSYSAYVYRRQKNGRYSYAFGDYRIRFAEGLIIGNGYFFGKKNALFENYNNRRSISPHTSTSEANFFRGAAASVKFDKITAAAFVSYNKCDAILNDDGEVTSFPKTGYHRTLTEQKRRNNTGVFAAGADVCVRLQRWNVGATAAFVHYGRKVNPRGADYNRYALRGRDFRAMSLHYNHAGRYVVCRGEVAMSEKKAFAFINTVKWRIFPFVVLTSIQRSYSEKFVEPFSNTFKTSGRVSNERGLYTGITSDLTNNLIIRAYADFYRMPHASYTYRAPLNGADYSVEAALHNRHGDNISLEWRGVRRKCDNGYNVPDSVPEWRNILKLSGKLSVGSFSFFSNLSGTVVSKRKKTSRGWMFNCRAAYKTRFYRITCGASYFKTDDYASRLYAYENNLKYVYNLFSTMYGHGIRFHVSADVKIGRRLELACKYAATNRFDCSTIGSGAQKTNTSYLSDLLFMFRASF